MKRWIKEAKGMYQRGFFDENPKSGLKLIATIEQLEKVTTILRNLYNEKSLLVKKMEREIKILHDLNNGISLLLQQSIESRKQLQAVHEAASYVYNVIMETGYKRLMPNPVIIGCENLQKALVALEAK